MSTVIEHIALQDVELDIPDVKKRFDEAESIGETIALCRWEDDGGAVLQSKSE